MVLKKIVQNKGNEGKEVELLWSLLRNKKYELMQLIIQRKVEGKRGEYASPRLEPLQTE